MSTDTLPEVRTGSKVPEALLVALAEHERGARYHRRYSSIVHVFHCLWLDADHWIGVAGDGDNGGYEHFDFHDGKLKITNVGYGMTDVALRDALNQWWPPDKVVDALKAAYARGHNCDLGDKCPGCMAGYALEDMTGRKWTQEECEETVPKSGDGGES